ncbi:hypothetical protein [Mycolicibacterium brisbanense]
MMRLLSSFLQRIERRSLLNAGGADYLAALADMETPDLTGTAVSTTTGCATTGGAGPKQ